MRALGQVDRQEGLAAAWPAVVSWHDQVLAAPERACVACQGVLRVEGFHHVSRQVWT